MDTQQAKRTFLINGKEKEAVWVEKQGHWDAHWEVGGVEFDGHFVLWGFSYEPKTYMKESELSGDEYRKGGTIKFFKDGIQVYEDFCRESERAAIRILDLLGKLQSIDWDKIKEGTKIFWRDTPAVIGYVMLEQGAFMVKVDGVERFPDPAWADEEWQKLEDPTEAKIDVLDPYIWWYRK